MKRSNVPPELFGPLMAQVDKALALLRAGNHLMTIVMVLCGIDAFILPRSLPLYRVTFPLFAAAIMTIIGAGFWARVSLWRLGRLAEEYDGEDPRGV